MPNPPESITPAAMAQKFRKEGWTEADAMSEAEFADDQAERDYWLAVAAELKKPSFWPET